MSCISVIDKVDAGSDIDFSIRPDNNGAYPDISDMTCNLTAYYERGLVLDISIGSPSANGSAVTLETDGTSQYLAIHIEGIETDGMDGNFSFYTHLESSAYGTRTEAKGIYEVCKVL